MPYRITQCYLPPDRGDIPAKDEGRKAKRGESEKNGGDRRKGKIREGGQ